MPSSTLARIQHLFQGRMAAAGGAPVPTPVVPTAPAAPASPFNYNAPVIKPLNGSVTGLMPAPSNGVPFNYNAPVIQPLGAVPETANILPGKIGKPDSFFTNLLQKIALQAQNGGG
jgi:hypothetical protein